MTTTNISKNFTTLKREANTQNKAPNNQSIHNKNQEKKPKFIVQTYEPLTFANKDWSETLNNWILSNEKHFLPIEPDFNIAESKISLYYLIGSKRNDILEKYFTNNERHKITAKESLLIAALIVRINRFRLRLYFVDNVLFIQKTNQPALNFKYGEFLKSLKKSSTILDFTIPESSALPKLSLESTINKLKKDFISHEKILKEFLIPFTDTFNLIFYPQVERVPPINKFLKSLAPLGQLGIQPDAHYFWSVVLMGDDVPMFAKPTQVAQWSAYKTEIRHLLHFLLLCKNLPDADTLMSQSSEKGNIINQPFVKFVNQPCSDTTFAAFINVANVLIPCLYIYCLNCIQTTIQ